MLLLFAIAIVFITLYSIRLYLFNHTTISVDLLILFFFLLKSLLLLLSGDVEKNPGPKSHSNLKVCHYNLNSIAAHSFAKISSLEAFNAVHNHDIITISESFLDSSFSPDDPRLALKGYKQVRADHPMNIKRGGLCFYYRDFLPIRFINVVNLPECLLCEISFPNQKCFIVSLYRSPSQSSNEFQTFLSELETIIESICTPGNSDLVILIGDFNAKDSEPCLSDFLYRHQCKNLVKDNTCFKNLKH